MGLEKIQIDSMGKILESILKSDILFFDYILISKNIQKINTPSKIVEFDFTFSSEKNNRWFFIRIQDFFSHQKLIIMLNQLNEKKNVNIDIQSFFISKLKNNTIKQKMIFKSTSEVELKNQLERIFEYLIENSDNQLKEIINGELWIDMPFDWSDYK